MCFHTPPPCNLPLVDELASWDLNSACAQLHTCPTQAYVMEIGSHELFRLVVGEADGCVVALGLDGGQQLAGGGEVGGGSTERRLEPGGAVHELPATTMGAAGSGAIGGGEPWLPAPFQLASCLREGESDGDGWP
jgi:hypothetical protein